jgi:hypothetical protein
MHCRGGSILDCLLQDVVEVPFAGAVARSPFRTERRSLLHLPQSGKKRAIQVFCTGSFHLGFGNELVALFLNRALRSELVKSVPDRLGVRAVDTRLKLEFHLAEISAGLPGVWCQIGSLIHRVTARSPLRTECNRASTVRPLVAFRQFVCRKTDTSRKSRLECDQAPNRLPEATAAPGCFFAAMTPSHTCWQLDPRCRALAPLVVRSAADARYSGAVRAGGLPTVP